MAADLLAQALPPMFTVRRHDSTHPAIGCRLLLLVRLQPGQHMFVWLTWCVDRYALSTTAKYLLTSWT